MAFRETYNFEDINFDAELPREDNNQVAKKMPIFKPFNAEDQFNDQEQQTCEKHDMRSCDPAMMNTTISPIMTVCGVRLLVSRWTVPMQD